MEDLPGDISELADFFKHSLTSAPRKVRRGRPPRVRCLRHWDSRYALILQQFILLKALFCRRFGKWEGEVWSA